MRFLSVLFLALAACPGTSKDSDSVATDDSTTTDCTTGTPTLTDWNWECDGGSPENCTVYAESDYPMGVVKVTVTETGDPTSTCGPKGGVNDCGVWEETHNGFTAAGSGSAGGACAERKELTLIVEDSFQNQVDNSSTLFGTQILDKGSVTVLIQIQDSSGAQADCDVFGDDPSYFAADCSN